MCLRASTLDERNYPLLELPPNRARQLPVTRLSRHLFVLLHNLWLWKFSPIFQFLLALLPRENIYDLDPFPSTNSESLARGGGYYGPSVSIFSTGLTTVVGQW